MRRTLLNPKIDFVFKKIFGSSDHPDILISFLNAVLKLKNPITSVEIKNSDLEKEYIEDKFSRLDVKALTSNKEIREAKDELYRLSRNSKERELYYLREKSLRDEISALANAEEKGLQQGLMQGKLESAKSLLDILDDDTIAIKLNIDINIVKNLRKEMLNK